MPKLTKEEKKALKELKKLLKAQEAEEERRKTKRDELDREIRAGELRKAAVDKKWREAMLEIKLPIFRQDVQVMWHTFERAYDKKENLIDYLMDLIKVADDQYQRTVASFCDTVDAMILKFGENLEELLRDNHERVKKLLEKGRRDADQLEADKDYAETHLQLVMYQSQQWATERFFYKKGINLVKADDERNKCEGERDLLRAICERRYNNMWEDYKSVIKNYVQNTSEIQKLSRRLRKKENENFDIIAAQTKQLMTIKSFTKRLQNELQVLEDGTQQAEFRDNRERHRTAYKRLRMAMSNGDKLDRDRLDNLVSASSNAFQTMATAREKGEKILRLVALCRKLETKREKIMPFGQRGPFSCGCDDPHEDGSMKVNSDMSFFDSELIEKGLDEVKPLGNLWERIARARLITGALRKERDQLRYAVINQRSTIEENKYRKFMADFEDNECKCLPRGHVYHSDATHIIRYM